MEQTSPPLSPRYTLPTMYDLPSEDPEEPGLPDEFHLLQPELLRQTFCPPTYEADEIFAASDLNLYYDLRHPQWYKRPDWFAVLGVPRLYDDQDLRLSYVMWQEGIAPFVVLELLSPGPEKEDLGRSLRDASQPPNKWTVYEQILRVPYYFVFNRYTDELQAFGLVHERYQPLSVTGPGFWLAAAELGLGLWWGRYQGVERLWLRWYDRDSQWILTSAEREAQRADLEQQRADLAEMEIIRLQRLLEQAGLNPDP
ncbi:Uma2 family endonuclease [Thermosynechococcaceae cyanobacterium BACA0444]|uniref:Uma2 family endonuclease n=1 Tax=Pseudocalidococcus azoricus BACA0444 TaxID=2918990 RepID=A0AAE4JXY2_9CYAN|nr:Uma2 family endonuclease [Pseudocalidococcus azoricus]MDS3861538.1 Uma2 family endonuclease [Pseudocalidococcus azoricus BACA0444]